MRDGEGGESFPTRWGDPSVFTRHIILVIIRGLFCFREGERGVEPHRFGPHLRFCGGRGGRWDGAFAELSREVGDDQGRSTRGRGRGEVPGSSQPIGAGRSR